MCSNLVKRSDTFSHSGTSSVTVRCDAVTLAALVLNPFIEACPSLSAAVRGRLDDAVVHLGSAALAVQQQVIALL